MVAESPHTPGAGLLRAMDVLGRRVPIVSAEDERRADALLERALGDFMSQQPQAMPKQGRKRARQDDPERP